MSTEELSRWWYLDLHAGYPELEMYYGGWKSEQELGLLELGERVMDAETGWLLTWIYSELRDRVWAAVIYMFRALREHGEVPPEWRPDTGRWDTDRNYPVPAETP